MATHFRILAWEIPWAVHGVPKSWRNWAHTRTRTCTCACVHARTHTHTHSPENTLKALQFQNRITDFLMSKSVFLGSRCPEYLQLSRPVPGLLSLQSHIWTTWRDSHTNLGKSPGNLCVTQITIVSGRKMKWDHACKVLRGHRLCLSRASRAWAVGTGGDECVAGPAATTVGGGLLLSPGCLHRSGPAGKGSSQVPALWSPPKSPKSPTQLPSLSDQLKRLKRLELAAASTHGPHVRLRYSLLVTHSIQDTGTAVFSSWHKRGFYCLPDSLKAARNLLWVPGNALNSSSQPDSPPIALWKRLQCSCRARRAGLLGRGQAPGRTWKGQ